MEESKKEECSSLKLYEGKDFTTSKLVDYLNDKFGSKKTGKAFKIGDIQQYLRRGFLPKSYGHHPICLIESEEIGVKVVRVDFTKTVK